MTGLCTIAVALLVLQGMRPEVLLWPGALALLPMLALLWIMRTAKSVTTWVAYLLVGGIGMFTVASLVRDSVGPELSAAGFSLVVLRICLVLIGTPTPSHLAAALWATAGWAVGEAAALAAAVTLGVPYALDVVTLFAAALCALTFPLVRSVSASSRAAAPLLHRAASEEAAASLRYGVEVRAAALVHDTVLSHLSAIVKQGSETLPDALRHGIERDLRSMLGEEWLTEDPSAADEQARQSWQDSGLFAAIQEARLQGLDVVTSGDRAAVARLGRDESIALGLAVKQCLVNVIRHAGVRDAEVVVYASDAELSVMVIDTGRGFSVAATGSDRLGLRVSVRRRMESVGGRVQVWSTPGRGTSVMIHLPVLETEGVR